jgi:hypothetical protein
VQRLELLPREAELVQRAGDRLVPSRRDHVGDVLQRAAAADGELGLEAHDLDGTRAEHVDEVLAQATPVALADRVRAHVLGGEAGDDEPHASGPNQSRRVADH